MPDQDQVREAMSSALTQYARSKQPSFAYTIVVTKNTRGGDLHLNGRMVVNVHSSLITQGIPIQVLINRVFDLIEEKVHVVERLRARYIVEAKACTVSNLAYLSRRLTPDEFQTFIETIL